MHAVSLSPERNTRLPQGEPYVPALRSLPHWGHSASAWQCGIFSFHGMTLTGKKGKDLYFSGFNCFVLLFDQRAPYFHFPLGSTNYVASSIAFIINS